VYDVVAGMYDIIAGMYDVIAGERVRILGFDLWEAWKYSGLRKRRYVDPKKWSPKSYYLATGFRLLPGNLIVYLPR